MVRRLSQSASDYLRRKSDMPPDGRMDTRADVYAAGLVIYEMLTGLPADRFPCVGERVWEFGKSPELARLNRLVLRACQPDPSDRFRDAREMLAELQAAERPAATGRVRSWRRRVVWVGCLVMGMAAAGWGAVAKPAPHRSRQFYHRTVRGNDLFG